MAMSNINVRVDSDKKAKAQELFSSLGMDMSTAINLFLSQSLEFNGIPFVIRKYNEETEAAFAEIEEMKKHPEQYKGYTNIDELFEDLDK
ncbi:MAG: type II toxin-antitoxin system RelB/DinJ family antitoxin [Clostridia bacterium]|nr:type II toxin-antitoxin system RelB/DinJ family antitoxin [Clostridia bacterium]